MSDFYDALAPIYHLIYPDWEASMSRQGRALSAIVRARSRLPPRSVLDAACGVGTQSLALAALGYEVTASDLSAAAVARTAREARARGLSLRTSVADMREVFDHHRRTFDVVLACDNAVPHLLSDDEILRAFEQFYRCTAPGGVCLVSIRDYDEAQGHGVEVHPHGVRDVNGTRYVLFQVWDWMGERYRTTMYVIEHPEAGEPITHAVHSTYYAVRIPALCKLLERAGFASVERLDGEFFQPILIGSKPAVA